MSKPKLNQFTVRSIEEDLKLSRNHMLEKKAIGMRLIRVPISSMLNYCDKVAFLLKEIAKLKRQLKTK